MACVNNSETGGGDRIVTGTPGGYGSVKDIWKTECAFTIFATFTSSSKVY